MPRRILLEEQRDFSGGLNLSVDPFDLADNESPRIENIDLDRRGGFGLRRGRRPYIETVLPAGVEVRSIIPYYKTNGTNQILVAVSTGQVYTYNGTTWDLRMTGASPGRYAYTTFGDRIYLSHTGLADVRRWDGTTMTTISGLGAYNDDLTAPTIPPANGFVPPRAGCLATHNGVMWAANLFEVSDLTQHQSRIRWSHPGFPEDWRTNDYIDIDPDDGSGPIRQIVPFQERLMVFKDRSVYAIHGFPPNGFSVQNITKDVGASSLQGVVATEQAVYFEDRSRGTMAYDGKSIEWIFEKLYPLIEDSIANPALHGSSALGWFNQRLWVSMPWLQDPYNNTFQTVVYDPRLNGGKGAWTRYTQNDSIVWTFFRETGGAEHFLGSEGLYVFETDVDGLFQDDRVAANPTLEIRGYYQTRWHDANNFALRKRWKRPEIVLRDNANLQLLVDVYTDYNPSHIKRSFTLTTEQDGTELVWDVGDWDENVWAGEGGDRATVERGSPLGNARAISLGFKNINQTNIDWRVHGLITKYIPKRIRN